MVQYVCRLMAFYPLIILLFANVHMYTLWPSQFNFISFHFIWLNFQSRFLVQTDYFLDNIITWTAFYAWSPGIHNFFYCLFLTQTSLFCYLFRFSASQFFEFCFSSLIATNTVWIFNVCGFPSSIKMGKNKCDARRLLLSMWNFTSVCSSEFNQNPFEANMLRRFQESVIFPLGCEIFSRFWWMSFGYMEFEKPDKKKKSQIATTMMTIPCYVKGRKFNLQYFSIKC